jgi:hypothetical protein
VPVTQRSAPGRQPGRAGVPAPVRPQILELQKDSEKNGVELAEKIHELQQKRAERDEAGQARRNHLKSASDAAEAYQSIAAELPHLRRRAAQAQDFYYEDYRELPEEEDAWEVGNEIASLTQNL